MMRFVTFLWAMSVLCVLSPLSAVAQMTDASTIRPILEATKANWIGVRRWEGHDLIYFTHLEMWKCGLTEIRFGVNDDPADEVYAFELCAEDEAAPSPMAAGHVPYVTLPLDSIEGITITLVYDDGSEVTEYFDRSAIELP